MRGRRPRPRPEQIDADLITGKAEAEATTETYRRRLAQVITRAVVNNQEGTVWTAPRKRSPRPLARAKRPVALRQQKCYRAG